MMVHRRSYYLDDLAPPVGSFVRCVANIASPAFTVGRVYWVHPGMTLQDDTGTRVRPSARFQPVN